MSAGVALAAVGLLVRVLQQNIRLQEGLTAQALARTTAVARLPQ